MPLSGKAMTDALAGRGATILGQTFTEGDASITLHQVVSVQAPTLWPVPVQGNDAALCARLTLTIGGEEKIGPDDWCVLMAHEIADMTNNQLADYLRVRLAAFAGG
jgi:hypothetical protein